MRLRRSLVLALCLGLAAPVVSHAATGPLPDPTVPAQRETEAVVLHGSDLATWAAPGNVTAKLPFTDLTCVQAAGQDCGHNSYAKPEADTGNALGAAVSGVDIAKLSGWQWNGKRFQERPFQVDEVFTRYLDNSASGFAAYSGQDQHTTYAFDREGFRWTQGVCVATPDSPVAKDPVPGLDTDDEVVFMAADAGSQAPADASMPKGASGAMEVRVLDPITQKASFFYVMLGRTPSFDADSGYVSYVRDADANRFEKSESSYEDYGNAAVGPVCDAAGNVIGHERRRPKDTGTITTDRYRYRYDGRWLMTDVRVSPDKGETFGPDLVDRWKARAFQQDAESETPCCGYEEEDTNWGGSSTLMGEIWGPVRAIRETWGADSGTNVVRRETFYRNEMTMKSWLRVHVIPPLDGIYAQWDYNAGRMTTFRSSYQQQGVAIDGRNDEAFGNLDDPCNPKYSANDTGAVTQTYRSAYKQAGLCGLPYHQSVDVADPTFGGLNVALQWGQTSGPWGTIVDRYQMAARDVTPGGLAQSAVTAQPYYRDDSCFDDATGTNPGPRLKLRSAGETQTWNGLPRTCWKPSDGAITDDSDPKYFQGSIGTHGVHLLFLVDSDNARQTVPVNEIVVDHRQVFLPGDPGNVGEQYGRGFEKPLVAVASPRGFTGEDKGGKPEKSQRDKKDDKNQADKPKDRPKARQP